jgi:hypothetical protein
MRANQATERPTDLVVFDTETTTRDLTAGVFELPLQFGYAEKIRWQTGRGKHHDQGDPYWSEPAGFDFDTRAEWWTWLEDQTRAKHPLWVFAHNLSGFDLMVMGGFDELFDRGWRLDSLIAECPPFVADFERDGHKIRLIDSLNYARMPLAKIGEALGMPKMEDPGEDHPEERRAYCRNDVAILREFLCGLIGFVQEHDLGNFKMTMASQAMTAWRHRFAPTFTGRDGRDRVRVIPTSDNESAFERKAYNAGRVEAFFVGKAEGPIHGFDVNSLFPSVMKANVFPWELRKIGDALDTEQAESMIEYGLGIVAEVTLDTDRPWYPFHDGERMIHPTGRFTTYLCTPELKLALDHGHVASIGRWQSYKMADLFSSYVDFFYERRRQYQDEGNDLYQMICKIGFLNSLYGKFGQKVPEWVDISGTDEATYNVPESVFGKFFVGDLDSDSVTVYRRFGNLVERQEPIDRETARNAFVAIAAHVTSYARVALLQAIEVAGSRNVFYCDTDSVYTNDEGAANLHAAGLVDQTGLGAWKHEGDADAIEIRGPKDYTWGDATKIKGVRKTAEQIDENTFLQTQFRGFRGAVLAGELDRMVISDQVKELRRVYKKGTVGPDGWVIPFVMEGDQDEARTA